MLSIAVCDDEAPECSGIAAKIKEILEEMKIPCILRQFVSGQELLQAPEGFDIIFLDIIMKGLDGMKTARMLSRKISESLLVFVSSSREYVFDAYEVEAFGYLVKPLEKNKLRQTLERAVLKLEARPSGYIMVSRDWEKRKLFLDDIYYLEVYGRQIYTHGRGESFSWYDRIGRLEKGLEGKGFFRCHKSYLVHLKYVTVYNRQEVTLDSGEKLPVAKGRYEGFCKAMLCFMRKNGGVL